MHIVLANQWYPPESGWGGVGMYNYAVAHTYRELGHCVTIIASRTSPDISALIDDAGISVRRLMVRDTYRWRRLPILGRYVRPVQQLAYTWRVNAALRELHREQPFDIVEFAEVNAEGFFFARNLIAPFVVRCHTPTFVLKRYYEPREMPYDTRIISWCERDLIRRAHALTAPSGDMASVIAHETGVPLEKIVVIPNALCLDQFPISCPLGVQPPTSKNVTILHVGRLERAKGVTILTDAIPKVVRQIPNARFVFIGDDRATVGRMSQRAVLEAQLADAGVRANVEFLGKVDQPTLIEWYRRADICVVPSVLYESFSYTCAQAMAMGKPVVATRIGGIPETVQDGVSGLIVTPGNSEELAEALIRLTQDTELRLRMGKAGREKAVREFDARVVVLQTLAVYDRAILAFRRASV